MSRPIDTVKFTNTVKEDTPRLVVMFKREGDKEQFQWGMVGTIPLLSLIGAIIHVQNNMDYEGNDECPEPALVIAWHNPTCTFDWFMHPATPIDSMRGMLETIKAAIVGSRAGQQTVAQQVLLGPDGQPMRR